ncbi:hypothetical protein F2P81_025893 [Scophthalmus maximus]|uniref:Integrase p58-like C-terminal domain-containing protein n=1 Tax=Scophthalmus maximus TaxID=52904 RepID=A0A6A4RTH7_SCOMX|nr:hypothetical protein F2P81_025893 [Scophthalmus maximus]
MMPMFDKDARARSFTPGEEVLLQLPIPGSALQARYTGPYVVQEKVNEQDYIVATPDRKRRSRFSHINMLKPYLDRGIVSHSPVREESREDLLLSSPGPIDVLSMAKELSSADPAVIQAASVDAAEEVIAVPTQTNVLQYDIDVGESPAIK